MKRICFFLVLFFFAFLGSSFSQNARQYMKAGKEFLKNAHYADAIVQFTKAIELSPTDGEAYLGRAEAYEKSEQLNEAAEDYVRAFSFRPKDETVAFNAGRLYYTLKKYRESAQWMDKVLQIKPKHPEAIDYKIKALYALRDYQKLTEACRAALALKENAEYAYLSGIALDSMGQGMQAQAKYQQAISLLNTYVDAYISLAGLQLRMNQADAAMETINKALKIDPNSVESYIVRSRIYQSKLEYPSAINDLSKAILINPNNSNLYYMRAMYYKSFTQFQNAISDFNKVLLMEPGNVDALRERAGCFEEIGDKKSAVKDYETLVALVAKSEIRPTWLDGIKSKLFELKRENEKPLLRLIDPLPVAKGVITAPRNVNEIKISGEITDQSDISTVTVNYEKIPVEVADGKVTFSVPVALNDSVIVISAMDVYNNTMVEKITVQRTEVDPPIVTLLAPYASDDGQIYLDSDDPNLYVEGNIKDESPIKSILIEGVSASYRPNDPNPSFAATVNIFNKNSITVTATDIYGNTRELQYKLNREAATISSDNPMGKTWAVFIENSDYTSFASLEGPTKDVSMMRAALAKYSVHNVIQKKNMTKKDMERFFAIELRDLVRSNRVNSLLIWYAGHGKFINETGYWIPVDAARDDEFTYYNINSLRAALQSYTNLTHILLVTDACESGPTFYQAMRSAPEIRSCNDWQATKFRSSQVFSSAGYELAVDNSQFTKTFANTLVNNPNSCIPIELIVNKVTQAVVRNNQQKPQFGKIAGLTDENGTFFFILKR